MLVNKISNTNYTSFKADYYDRVRRIEDNNSLFSSKFWNAEEIVEREMRSEINDLERQIARKEEELRSSEQRERSNRSANYSILSNKRSRLSSIKDQTRYNENTVIPGIERTLSYLGTQASDLSSANYSARSAISQQESDIEKIKKDTKDLQNKNDNYQKQLKEEAEQKIKSIKADYDKKTGDIANDVNNSVRKPNAVLQDIYMPKQNGFGQIAGFESVKKTITAALGQFIVLEKNGKTVDIPNGILLYGPDAENNKNIAETIAKQFGTKSVLIPSDGNETEKFNRIKEASVNAKSYYEQGKGRTLILINDFDKFASKGSRMVGPLKSLLDNISKDFYATVVATTDTPERVDDILLRSGRFESKIAIPAMAEKDILASVKKYISLDAFEKFNIISISQMLENAKNGGAYTVKNLKTFLQSFNHFEQIKQVVTDIKPEQMKKFKHQLEYVKHI